MGIHTSTRRGFMTLAGAGFGAATCVFAGKLDLAATPKQVKIVDFDGTGKRKDVMEVPKIVKSDDEWKKQLNPQQFDVTRKAGTEPAFTGKYWNNHQDGIYSCVCCGTPLFDSKTKFESGTGWPSFYQPLAEQNVTKHEDRSFGEIRTEVECARCDGHLGHVFDDGPRPTGLRYCMNSASLNFTPRAKA